MKMDKPLDDKSFKAVEFMRQARDKVSREIADLSKEEIVEYFKKNIPKERIMPKHTSAISQI